MIKNEFFKENSYETKNIIVSLAIIHQSIN
jgi:hypothetical protein